LLLCFPLFPITYEPLPQFDKGGVTGKEMKMSTRYRYEWPVWRRLKEKLVYLTSGNRKEGGYGRTSHMESFDLSFLLLEQKRVQAEGINPGESRIC